MNQHIRVVVAAVSAEAARAIADLMSEDREIEIVGLASEGNTALSQARELFPDVLLVDLALPGINGVKVTEILDEEVPTTAVIVMADQQNVNELRNAMKAGARDLLVKPMQSQDVIASVRGAFE